nr:TonB-dependent receptor [uncultured Carboxylicivirga sp.]
MNLNHLCKKSGRILIRAFFSACLIVLGTQGILGQENISVTGTVIDSNGEPIAGATVIVQGTTTGTITSYDGVYNITVPSNGILEFSFIGFTKTSLNVNNQRTINVTLEEETTQLDELVVVGYGVQKKSDVTGALTSVSAEVLQEMPVKDALQGMQGKAAGVDITNSQRPGEVGSISIRGVRSLTASNSPLYVVDGMVIQNGGIENINPSDIESIDVLKDASATAIYGSRGANGVILVTTKSGKAGKVTVSYNGSVTVSHMSDVMEMMDAAEWLQYSRLAKFGSIEPNYELDHSTWGQLPDSWANIQKGWTQNNTVWDPSAVGNYDWASEGKQTGVATEHTLSVSGGNEKYKGYASFGYLNQTGTIKGQEYTRYTSKLSFEATPVDWFTMGASANISYDDQDFGYRYSRSVTGAGDYYGALRSMLPWSVPYDAEGNFIEFPTGDTNIQNPIDELNYSVNQNQRYRLNGSVYSQLDFGNMWAPLKGLRYRFQFGPEFYYGNRGTFYDARGINGNGSNVADASDSRTISWTIDNLVYYNNIIADKHDIGLTLMQSAQGYESTNMSVKANVASSDELWYNLSSKGDIQGYGSGLTERQMSSYMIRANYGFDNKYLITASVRWDGASQLAEGNKWASFPSLALGWRLEQEDFMASADWIDQLKLRFGYGQTGNSAISAYATKGLITTTYYNWHTDASSLGYLASDPSARYPAAMANKELGWERTTQLNYGFDYAFINGRVGGSFDYYTTKTTDLLTAMTIPSLTGYTTTYANVGETSGWGIDFQINTLNIKTKDFKWETSINWSKDNSTIDKLANGLEEDVNNKWFVGQNIGVFYDYVYDGVYKTEDAAEAEAMGRKVGNIRVKDISGPDGVPDGIIDANYDRAIVGTTRPDWTGGMTNTFTYKNWDLSFFIYARMGGTINKGAETLDGRYAKRKLDYFIPGINEDAEYYQPGINGEGADTYSSSQGYQDASYIKLRNINLGYTFSNNTISSVGISSLKLYAQCINPLTIYSAVDWLDPDLRDYSNNRSEMGSPITIRSYVFGVRVSF